MPSSPILSIADLVARIPVGAKVAVPRDPSGVAMAATRALLRLGTSGLHLVAVPTSGLQADLLIGAGAVATLETSAVSLGEFGPAPAFARALADGRLHLLDATCPAIHAGLQAAEKGVPFLPLRGLIGSDVLRFRPDWLTIDNPFAPGDPIVVLPAIRPDVALFHAPLADTRGNVWIGRRRELATMAHAAKASLATVEALHDCDLFADERLAAGALSNLYVDAVAVAPRGAWPLAFEDAYPADGAVIAGYARAAATAGGFAAWLERHLREA